jgi:hypothetical protein
MTIRITLLSTTARRTSTASEQTSHSNNYTSNSENPLSDLVSTPSVPQLPRPDPIRDANLAALGRIIARAKRCIVVAGAGISCNAGIPVCI